MFDPLYFIIQAPHSPGYPNMHGAADHSGAQGHHVDFSEGVPSLCQCMSMSEMGMEPMTQSPAYPGSFGTQGMQGMRTSTKYS